MRLCQGRWSWREMRVQRVSGERRARRAQGFSKPQSPAGHTMNLQTLPEIKQSTVYVN